MERVERPTDHAFFAFSSKCPRTLKGIGSETGRKRHPARPPHNVGYAPFVYKGVVSITPEAGDSDGRSEHTCRIGPAGGVEVDDVPASVPVTAGGNVAACATSFALVPRRGCVYKAVERTSPGNPIPCDGFPPATHPDDSIYTPDRVRSPCDGRIGGGGDRRRPRHGRSRVGAN